MRRASRRLDLTLLLAVAPLVAACDDEPERRCATEDEQAWVDDAECERQDAVPPGSAAAGAHRGVHWIWVPRRYGGTWSGGSWYGRGGSGGGGSSSGVRPGSPSHGSSSSTARGGFGSTGAGHSTGHAGG